MAILLGNCLFFFFFIILIPPRILIRHPILASCSDNNHVRHPGLFNPKTNFLSPISIAPTDGFQWEGSISLFMETEGIQREADETFDEVDGNALTDLA